MASPTLRSTSPGRPDLRPAVALALVLLIGLVVRTLVTLLPDLILGEDG